MAEDLFKKNMEMWEQFTANYMDTMFKTVEKTMEQSNVFKAQVDKAVNTAVNAQLTATLSALQILQRQVEVLTTKIDQLVEERKSA